MRRLALLLILAAACSKQPALSTGPDSITTPEGRARMLALMTSGGGLPVDKEIDRLQSLVQRQPEKLEAWIELGHFWIRKARDAQRPGLYANAGACADLVLARQPTNRPALELQGLVLMNDHRFQEARSLMSTVLARTPDDPVALGTLSDADLELGRTQEAVEAAQRMMDLKPNLPSYSRAAHLQWLRGDLQDAKESLRLAIDAGNDGKDKEPKAWVMVQAAMLFWNEGDADGAEAGFDQTLVWLPEFPPALAGKARVLLGRGDGKAAAALLVKAYQVNPLVETGWLLGDALALAGDADGSQRAWAEIEKRGKLADPRTLALFWATKDRQHEAALQLAEAERKTRDDEYTEDVIAWALYRAGRLDEALAASDKANALGTRDARLWFHAGAIRLAKGETAKGQSLIRKALELNPHFDLAGEAEARRLLDARMAKGK